MDLDDFIWGLNQRAGAPPVSFVYAFVYICRRGVFPGAGQGDSCPDESLELPHYL
jgi:hypothetical protein